MGIQILVVVVAKLGVLVAGGVFLLVLEPHEVEVGLAAIAHNPLMDGSKIGHNILSFSADIVRRIKGRFHIGGTEFLQIIQRNAMSLITIHDEGNGAVADAIPPAAIVVRNAPQTHFYDA